MSPTTVTLEVGLKLQQLPMQGSCPLHWQIRFRLDVVTHDSGQTRELDALGRCQCPLDFLVDQGKPPLIQRVAPGNTHRSQIDRDSTE